MPVLDIGAGTGRNAIPLCSPRTRRHRSRAGSRRLAEELRKAAAAAGVPLEIVEASALSPELELPKSRFGLVVLSGEVVTHLRDRDELATLMSKIGDSLVPGGRLLFNAFVALEGYKPDPATRQVAEVAWCPIFTRNELSLITEGIFPSIGSATRARSTTRRTHLPAEAWPPTPWFEDWAQGRNIFALPPGKAPVELRWLEYVRR